MSISTDSIDGGAYAFPAFEFTRPGGAGSHFVVRDHPVSASQIFNVYTGQQGGFTMGDQQAGVFPQFQTSRDADYTAGPSGAGPGQTFFPNGGVGGQAGAGDSTFNGGTQVRPGGASGE